ncbi:putative glucuronosyltransferase GUT1 [Hordeum vulgare]|nr:putative glucuronosyltransferase GUT1 [Hordeum vulgare]
MPTTPAPPPASSATLPLLSTDRLLLAPGHSPAGHHVATSSTSGRTRRASGLICRSLSVLVCFRFGKSSCEGGLVCEKLWDLMVNEPDVIMEEGFPNATGREQSIKGMRTLEFCLHPAGDIPSSRRLFDVVASLCIRVIVSDDIELPFKGMIDYTKFSISVTVGNAMRTKWLTNYLRNISKQQKDDFRRNLARVQHIFQYENSQHDSWDSAQKMVL